MGKRLPKRMSKVQLGWVVKARVATKKKQWYEKEKQHRLIEVFVLKTISQNFLSESAADAYRALAEKDPRYVSVYVTTNYGEDDIL